jgi:hypothetical protein
MAFCTNCGHEISAAAPTCPNCGQPQTGPGIRTKRPEPLAVISLCLGVAGFVLCPLIAHIAAVITGYQARKVFTADPEKEGAGMAKAGIVLGWVGVALSILAIALLAAFAYAMRDFTW